MKTPILKLYIANKLYTNINVFIKYFAFFMNLQDEL